MMEKPIDRIDRKILSALTKDGRLTNNQLAEQVGLSSAPCWQRVKRLERDGYIQGYTAVLDQTRLGMSDTVIIEVALNRHIDDVVEAFGRTMAALPEVLEVYVITGAYDYYLKVAVNGTAGYEDFLRKRIYNMECIRQFQSIFTLRCLKKSFSVSPLVADPV